MNRLSKVMPCRTLQRCNVTKWHLETDEVLSIIKHRTFLQITAMLHKYKCEENVTRNVGNSTNRLIHVVPYKLADLPPSFLS